MQLLALFPFQRKRLAQFFSPSHHRIFGARDILGGHVDTPTTKLSPREPAHASCEREVQCEIYDHIIQLVVKNPLFLPEPIFSGKRTCQDFELKSQDSPCQPLPSASWQRAWTGNVR